MDLGLSITIGSGIFGAVGLAAIILRNVYALPNQGALRSGNSKETNGYASRKDVRALEQHLQEMRSEVLQRLDAMGTRLNERFDAQEKICSERRERIVRLEEKVGVAQSKSER